MIFAMALSLGTSALAADGDLVDVATRNGSFKTLVTALNAAELVTTLQGPGPFTVFAPTDAAFAALPPGTLENLLKPENKAELASLLTYHVVAGKLPAAEVKAGPVFTLEGDSLDVTVADGKVKVDAATVQKKDVMASNGIIHVIDAVIMPSVRPEPEPEPEPVPEPLEQNIVNVATANGSFGTLLAAAQAAGLVEKLSGPGPFTVFAPTDAAFAKIDGGIVELMKPENKARLAEIIEYHVVPGKLNVGAFESGKIGTVEGSSIKVKVKNGKITLNKDVTVVTPDVEATNGVIHVVDGVLMPK